MQATEIVIGVQAPEELSRPLRRSPDRQDGAEGFEATPEPAGRSDNTGKRDRPRDKLAFMACKGPFVRLVAVTQVQFLDT